MVKIVKTYSELDMSIPLDTTMNSLDNTIEQSNSSSTVDSVVSIKRQKKSNNSPPVSNKNMTRYFS